MPNLPKWYINIVLMACGKGIKNICVRYDNALPIKAIYILLLFCIMFTFFKVLAQEAGNVKRN